MTLRGARLLLCLGLLVLGACSAKHYERTPGGIVVSPAGGPARKLSLRPVSATVIHVTAVPGESLELPASLMAVNAGDGKTPFEVAEHGGTVVLKTAGLSA